MHNKLESDKTSFEVERKFRISEATAKDLPDKLASCGFTLAGHISMTDTFLLQRKPGDKCDKGDMLRIRDEEVTGADGSKRKGTLLTSKRWVKVADGSEEREELEDDIGKLAKQSLITFAERLTGGPLASYTKQRTAYCGKLEDWFCVACIDRADGLGSYSGNFLEIEILTVSHQELPKIRESILAFAEKLLGTHARPESLSYMEMLLLKSVPSNDGMT